MALGLLFLAEVDLAAPYCRDVGCGDSSGFGHALLRRQATDQELREAMRHRERWRFLAVPVEDASLALGPEELAFSGASAEASTLVRGGPLLEPASLQGFGVGSSLAPPTRLRRETSGGRRVRREK